LLDKQLAEAERRAVSERRQLVDAVEVKFDGRRTGRVVNNSRRPINDVTSKVMSKFDRHSLATPVACGELTWDSHAWRYLPEAKPDSRLETLRPEAICGFSFDALPDGPEKVLVAWFTDDDGFRWQLDEYQHLTESSDENVYLPVKAPRPLPQSTPDSIGPARSPGNAMQSQGQDDAQTKAVAAEGQNGGSSE
jgi:hypothetical protein